MLRTLLNKCKSINRILAGFFLAYVYYKSKKGERDATPHIARRIQHIKHTMSYIVGSILHGGPSELFPVQPLFLDWCNKGRGMCYPVCGMMHIKNPCCYSESEAHVAVMGFLSRYLSGPLPYVRRHITVNKMC